MRHSRECLTTVVRHSCERLTTVRQSCDIRATVSRQSRDTFARVSHDVRANFHQFYLTQLSLEMVLFMSHICRIVQIAETSLRCVCERLRRVGEGFPTYAMTWRRFCDNFCRTKKYYMFKTLATSSRRVRDACEDFAIPCERFATVSRQFGESICKPIANSSHHSEIGALTRLD